MSQNFHSRAPLVEESALGLSGRVSSGCKPLPASQMKRNEIQQADSDGTHLSQLSNRKELK